MATVANLSFPRNARSAEFEGVHGVAYCDAQRTVWFVADDTEVPTLLHNADICSLMLYGNIAVASDQATADGDLFVAVDRRNSHHPKAAKAA